MRKLTILAGSVAAAVVCGAPVAAAVFTYDMVVVESIDERAQVNAPEFDLPDLGTTGTVVIRLDGAALDADGDPDTGVNAPEILDLALTGASADFGTLDTEITMPLWRSVGDVALLSNTDFSALDVSLDGVDCGAIGCTFAGTFRAINAAYAPTTFAEIEAMLADPTSLITFSFNGTAADEFVSFEARSRSVPEVPLPASALFLLASLGAVGGLRLARRGPTG